MALPGAAALGIFGHGIEPLDLQFRTYYVVWTAIAHAIQYLWITTYYAKASPTWPGYAPYLAKALGAGALVWNIPLVLFASNSIGLSRLAFEDGLGILVVAAVNMHHFVLDGAIWKLRSSRIASVLIRSQPDAQQLEPTGVRVPGIRAGVWGAAAACVAIAALAFWQESVAFPQALLRRQFDTASIALDRLAWTGRSEALPRIDVARGMAAQGDSEGALRELERSALIRPRPATWALIGQVEEREGRWTAAAEAWEAASRLAPQQVEFLDRAGAAWMRAGRPDRGQPLLERARALAY